MSPWDDEIDHVALDDAFVASARVHEDSAEARRLAVARRQEAALAATPRAPAPGVAWSVRPYRHLRGLRPGVVWTFGGLLTLAAALPVTLGLWR